MNVMTVQLSSAVLPGTRPPPPAQAVRVPTVTTAAAMAPAIRVIGEGVTDIRASFVLPSGEGVRLRIAFLDTIVA